jgi:hypothetical protein
LKRITAISLAVMALSCGNGGTGPEALDPDTFAAAYIALLENSLRPPAHAADSTAAIAPDTVLSKLGVTQDEFLATVRSYRADARRWGLFFEQVVKRLEEKANAKPGEPLPEMSPPIRPGLFSK